MPLAHAVAPAALRLLAASGDAAPRPGLVGVGPAGFADGMAGRVVRRGSSRMVTAGGGTPTSLTAVGMAGLLPLSKVSTAHVAIAAALGLLPASLDGAPAVALIGPLGRVRRFWNRLAGQRGEGRQVIVKHGNARVHQLGNGGGCGGFRAAAADGVGVGIE